MKHGSKRLLVLLVIKVRSYFKVLGGRFLPLLYITPTSLDACISWVWLASQMLTHRYTRNDKFISWILHSSEWQNKVFFISVTFRFFFLSLIYLTYSSALYNIRASTWQYWQITQKKSSQTTLRYVDDRDERWGQISDCMLAHILQMK